jgi:hypothetical protein
MCYIIISTWKLKRFHEKGIEMMGTIVCQDCESTITHFEDEKVTVLYGKCDCCCDGQHKEQE